MALNQHVQPPGDNIPISIEYFLEDYLVPTQDDIESTVGRIRSNCSGGPSGMRADHLKH